MREYGKIKTSFWAAPKVRGLSEQAKLLLLYLYACPHGNAIGCFLLPAGYVSEDLDWPPKRVSELLSELGSKGFIERDEGTRLTRIRSWWEHNTVENRNVARGVLKVVLALPKCTVLANAIADLKAKAVGNEFLTAVQTEFPTVSLNEVGIPEPEPEPEPESGAPTRVIANAYFDRFWKAYPHRGTASDPRKPAAEKFDRAVRAGIDPETIIRGAEGYAKAQAGKDPQYNQQAATWIHKAGWEQYANPTPSPTAVPQLSEDEIRIARLERFIASATPAEPEGRWYSHHGPKPESLDAARAELARLRPGRDRSAA